MEPEHVLSFRHHDQLLEAFTTIMGQQKVGACVVMTCEPDTHACCVAREVHMHSLAGTSRMLTKVANKGS